MITLKSNVGRANMVRVIFYLLLTISIVSLFSLYLQYQLITGGINGTGISQEAADANDMRQSAIARINFILILASSVVFLVWVYRAYDNLTKLNINTLNYTPGWAVGYWFVPILSLYKPYSVMKEIWEETQYYVLPPEQKKDLVKPRLVALWWTLYIFNIIVIYIVRFAYGRDTTLKGLQAMTTALMISGVFTVLVKAVTLVMVNRMVIFERELYEHVQNTNNAIPEAPLVDAPAV